MIKTTKTKNYNYIFNTKSGFFARWGKTLKDDPQMSPVGPELADIEISTICHGLGQPCAWCYKTNNPKGENMSLKAFKKIFSKLPKNLTQIAFGIGDVGGNKDMFKIFKYCRKNGIVPNITINGYNLTDNQANNFVRYCGAVAVSRYKPVKFCYDAVKKLTDRGMKQVNIHMLVANETYQDCLDLLEDAMEDKRLKGLNAIVFLSLKKKGQRNFLTPLGGKKYKKIVAVAMDKGLKIGFDSCSAYKFQEAVKGTPKEKLMDLFIEPCESTLFSIYINVKGLAYPCSFCEGEKNFKPVDANCKDFLKDVWNNKEMVKFRKGLLRNKRKCPIFKI